jgi:Flp pilus assembly CpaF family ATPase
VCARYFEPDCICTVSEDNAELHLDQLGPDKKPWTNYTASLATVVSARGDQDQIITMAGLVRNALRFRPDRIIVGEARGAEMAEVAKALTSGHDGSFTSIHADSSIEALDKGAQLMGEDPRYHNVEYAKETMHRAFDLVVHLARFKGRRVIESIAVVSRGNSQLVYSMTEAGAWITHIHHVDNIPKLKLKEALRTYFRDGILPVTGGGLADGVR